MDDAQIMAFARNRIAQLEAADTSAGKVTIADGAQIDLTTPVVAPPMPDPDAAEKIAFFTGLAKLRNLLIVLPPTDKRVADLQATLSPQVDKFI